jgi:hypothetical protein
MVNFERPREVQSSLKISVTKYFILNFKGSEGKKEKGPLNSEFIAVCGKFTIPKWIV